MCNIVRENGILRRVGDSCARHGTELAEWDFGWVSARLNFADLADRPPGGV